MSDITNVEIVLVHMTNITFVYHEFKIRNIHLRRSRGLNALFTGRTPAGDAGSHPSLLCRRGAEICSRVPLERAGAAPHDGYMKFMTISKARANLSELARHVAAGDETIVTQRGVPTLKIVRADIPGRRPLGVDVGAFRVPDSFDDPIDWSAPQESNR